MNDFVEGLSYNDVRIIPNFSHISSRSIPDTSVNLNGIKLEIPLISANMDTVTESEMASAMSDLGGTGVIHRFCSPEHQALLLREANSKKIVTVGAALGTGEAEKRRAEVIFSLCDYFVVDIAHGHSKHTVNMIRWLKENFNMPVMAGNVATPDGAMRLEDAGADIIKVGIGPGAACTTRMVAGVGVPQFTAVYSCARATRLPVVADGGVSYPADVAIAVAAGASAVMVGSLFAACNESPSEEEVDVNGVRYKKYRGMASLEAQLDRGDDPERIIPEGMSGLVEAKGPVSGVIKQLTGGLRSAMSYVGAENIPTFQRKAKFVKITNAGLIESNHRFQI